MEDLLWDGPCVFDIRGRVLSCVSYIKIVCSVFEIYREYKQLCT